jgi:exonuclease SbcC
MRKGLEEHRFESVEEARATLVDAGQLNRLRMEAREITQNLVTLQERLRDIAARIGDRAITRQDVEQLEAERNVASRRNDEAIQRTGAAGSELEKCRQGNAAWHTLVREEAETIAKAESAEQLQRYLQGDAFVGYLADERLGDICRRATEQLRVLTHGCYELRTRPSDGFYIIDNGNGGGERAPSSLSGGETFLVSLSLALALSDMVQMGRSPLEFFFLDEGFGTLDSDLLDTVMNSLEQLRSQHRTIGVITHVTGLRERISRRLNVLPATEIAGSRVEFEVV